MKLYRPEIRFRDMDAMGHVNNATYFTYMEQARIQYFRDLRVEKWDWIEEGVVVAKNELNYKTPLFFDEEVVIKTFCSHLGNKSVTLTSNIFKIVRGQEILAAHGACVLVSFNHKTQQTQDIPGFWRSLLQQDLEENQV